MSSLASHYSRVNAEKVLRLWRLHQLTQEHIFNDYHGHLAAAHVRKLWAEITDHATHSITAVCPALALKAIHKTWEYGPLHRQVHFEYGPTEKFGFRDMDEIMEHMGDVDCIPKELTPSRLFPRRLWEMPSTRDLPKLSDPANAHRPLCDRSRAPTNKLDKVLCAVGLAMLRLVEISEHLDIDSPAAVPKLFEELSQAVPHGDVAIANTDADMKGCFTNVPQTGTVRAVEYIVEYLLALGFRAVSVPKRTSQAKSVVVKKNLRKQKGCYVVPLSCLAEYTKHHSTTCFSRFGKIVQKQNENPT